MDKLLELIKKRQAELDEKIAQRSDELNFFDQIYEDTDDNLEAILNLAPGDIAAAYLLSASNRNYSAEKAIIMVDNNEDIINFLDPNDINELLMAISKIVNNGVDDKTIKMLSTVREIDFDSIKHPNTQYCLALHTLLRVKKCKKYDLTSFIACDNFTLLENFVSSLAYRFVLQDVKKILGDTGLDKCILEILYKDKIKEVKQNAAIVRNHYERLKSERVYQNRIYKREKSALSNLVERLPRALSTPSEIENVQELLKKISDPAIRLEILKLVYEHNINIYKQLEQMLQQLSLSPTIRYKNILNKYGISTASHDIDKIMSHQLPDIEAILKFLATVKITDQNQILRILCNSNREIIDDLSEQMNNGYIDSAFLRTHSSIFSADSRDYLNLTTNLAYLKLVGVNPINLSQSGEVLLLPNATLSKNMLTLKDYGLLQSIKKGSSYQFLGAESLEHGIDTLIELGYEESLSQHLSLLNYQDRFNRLRLLKSLNNMPQTDEELLSVLTTDKFFIQNQNIEDYIYNAAGNLCPELEPSEEHDVNLDFLQGYSSTERSYNFNGVIVSKNRLRRNLSRIAKEEESTVKGLTYAIMHDGFISDDESSAIKEELSSKVKNKK